MISASDKEHLVVGYKQVLKALKTKPVQNFLSPWTVRPISGTAFLPKHPALKPSPSIPCTSLAQCAALMFHRHVLL